MTLMLSLRWRGDSRLGFLRTHLPARCQSWSFCLPSRFAVKAQVGIFTSDIGPAFTLRLDL